MDESDFRVKIQLLCSFRQGRDVPSVKSVRGTLVFKKKTNKRDWLLKFLMFLFVPRKQSVA